MIRRIEMVMALAAFASASLVACAHGDMLDAEGYDDDASASSDAHGQIGINTGPSYDAGTGRDGGGGAHTDAGSGEGDAGAHEDGSHEGGAGSGDAETGMASNDSGASAGGDATGSDAGTAPHDASVGPPHDASVSPPVDANTPPPAGIITGGPCASGASGSTALRVRFGNANGQAQVDYEILGLPDPGPSRVTVSGYEIGFTSTFTDQYLAVGGVALDDEDFIDIQLNTSGVATIRQSTIAILGRSFNVDTDGSFSWQSFTDTGATDIDFVSNAPPYQWYAADLGDTIAPSDAGVRVRLKAGPSSESLVISEIEICLDAE